MNKRRLELPVPSLLLGVYLFTLAISASVLYSQHQKSSDLMERTLQNAPALGARIVAQVIQPLVSPKVKSGDLYRTISNLKKEDPSIELFFLNKRGIFRTDLNLHDKPRRVFVSLSKLQEAVSAETGSRPTIGEDPMNLNEQTEFTAAKIKIENEDGYLYLTRNYSQLTESINPGGRGVVKSIGLRANRIAFIFSLAFVALIFYIQKIQSRKQLDMIAAVAHDMKAPITTISAHLETLFLKNAELLSKKREEFLLKSMNHLQELNGLVADLSYTRAVEASQQFSLAELLEHVIFKQNDFASRRNIKLEFVTEQGEFDFLGKPLALERVFSNIIGNAIKYSKPDSTVKVSLDLPSSISGKGAGFSGVRITVQDFGIGISEKELKHVGTPLFRTSNAQAFTAKGTGLGLTIARQVVEAHSGSLKIDSVLDKGTTVEIKLPFGTEEKPHRSSIMELLRVNPLKTLASHKRA